jgi:hypothetical protein
MKMTSVPALVRLEVLAVLLLTGLALHGSTARAATVEVTYPPYVSHMLLGQLDLPICVCTVTLNGIEVRRVMRDMAEQMARSPGATGTLNMSLPPKIAETIMPGANTLRIQGRYVDEKAAADKPVSVALHGFNADGAPDETNRLFLHQTKARGPEVNEEIVFTLDAAKVKLPTYWSAAQKQALPLSDAARGALGKEIAALGAALKDKSGKKAQARFAAFAKSVSAAFPKEQRPLVAKSVGARGPSLARLIVAGSVQVPDAAGLDYTLLGDRLVMPVVKGTPHLYRFKLQFEGEEAEEYGFTPLFALIEGRWQPLFLQSAQLIQPSP